MAQLPIIAAVATAGAAVVGAGAQIYQGMQQKEAADQTAHTLESQGKADFASAQRDSLQKELETKYLLSAQQAQAAASGAGAGTDAPTIVRMMTETAKRGTEAQENITYGGTARRDAYDKSAAAERSSGNMSFLGSLAGGVGTLIAGAGDYAKAKQRGLVA